MMGERTGGNEARFADGVRLLEPRAWTSADPRCWSDLGCFYAGLGWHAEAEAAWRRALALDPVSAAAASSLVDLLVSRGLPHSAQRVLQDARAAGADPAWC